MQLFFAACRIGTQGTGRHEHKMYETCAKERRKLQSQPEEGTGAPFILVDHNDIVIKDGIVHHEGGTREVARREIIDDGGTFVEDHVKSHALSHLALAVHGEFVAVIDDEGGEHREMEQPFSAEHPIVAIASTDSNMADVDVYIRGIRVPGFQFIACLDTSSLIADACQPRACRTALDVALGESGRERETAMVESVVASEVDDLQREVVCLQSLQIISTMDVARQCGGTLVAEIEADATAVVVEVELIVLVDSFPLGRVNGHSDTYSAVYTSHRERGLMAGFQVGLAISIIHRSPSMEGITRLVHSHLQRETSLGTYDIARVIGCPIVSGREHTIHLRPHLLVAALGISLI